MVVDMLILVRDRLGGCMAVDMLILVRDRLGGWMAVDSGETGQG